MRNYIQDYWGIFVFDWRVFFFISGIGSVYLLLFSELLDTSMRMIGICICMFFSTLSMFLLARYFEGLISVVGSATTFWLYSANCLFFSVFILLCIPETKNKTFSEIQEALKSGMFVREWFKLIIVFFSIKFVIYIYFYFKECMQL